jgi:drug/metabolite transporter (DMT)-like permease
MVMFPVVALMLSVLFEGLQITVNIVAGAILVTAGNIIILRRERAAVPVIEPVEEASASLGVEKSACR